MSTLIKSNQPCPNCTSSDALAIYSDNEHCFSCGYHNIYNFDRQFFKPRAKFNGKLPARTSILNDEYWCDWFRMVGINPIMAKKANLSVSKDFKDLVIPMYSTEGKLVGYELRLRNPDKFKSLARGKKAPILVSQCKDKTIQSDIVCIVEDIRSALKVSKHVDVLCLMGTSVSKFEYLNRIQPYKKVLIWLDGDSAGREAANKLSKTSHLIKFTQQILTHKDPKYYTDEDMIFFLGLFKGQKSCKAI